MEQHKSCTAEQFEIGFDHENSRKYVKYTPRVTNNVQGGLKHRRVEINPIIQYEDRSNPRCLVLLNEKYLSLIPSTGPLYRKPLETVASYGPKFGANTIPANQMSQICKRFYAEAGIDTTWRNISNHSGRVACCTRLYNEGFTDNAVISVVIITAMQFILIRGNSNTLGAPAPQIVKTENTSASTCNIKSEPCIENETRVREADEILKIEVPDNVRKIVIVKGDTKMDMEI